MIDRLLSALGIGVLLSIGAAVASAQPPEPRGGQAGLVPDTSTSNPVLELDFPEVHIGIAEYAEGPTGATVFYFPEPVMSAIDVRGGAPGVINSEALRLHYEVAYTNAVSFAGGSSYGLSVATGVAEAIKERTENPGNWENIAFVPGAIIFDLGGRRFNAVTPDHELGKAALRAAKPGVFPQGAQGAGRFAMQGWFVGDPQHSGQGGAFRAIGQTKVAVFTVVNSLGSVVDRDGRVVRCSRPSTDGCGRVGDRIEAGIAEQIRDETDDSGGLTQNTTITLVVTNEKLAIASLQRLANQVHTSMARAIQPFSTANDGDTLIAVTTGQVETEGLSPSDLGVLASEVAWDAVLASVPELPDPGPVEPITWSAAQLDAAVGKYRFSPWSTIRLEREGDALVALGPETPNLYFPSDAASIRLVPVSPDELVMDTERAYRIKIDSDEQGVTGLTLEPGPWAKPATRVR